MHKPTLFVFDCFLISCNPKAGCLIRVHFVGFFIFGLDDGFTSSDLPVLCCECFEETSLVCSTCFRRYSSSLWLSSDRARALIINVFGVQNDGGFQHSNTDRCVYFSVCWTSAYFCNSKWFRSYLFNHGHCVILKAIVLLQWSARWEYHKAAFLNHFCF